MKQILKEIYNLSDTEVKIIFAMIEGEDEYYSVKELAKELDKNRTTIQKYLKNLNRLDLVTFRQVNKERGFMYVYKMSNEKNLIESIKERIDIEYKEKIDKIDNIKTTKLFK